MKFSRLFSSMLVGSIAVGATIIACGGSTPKKPDGKVTVIDSPGGSGSCVALASYSPSFGSNQSATNYPAAGSGSTASPHIEDWAGALAQGTVLEITLFAGYGGFGSGDIKNGNYTITGDDAIYSKCGICASIAAGITQSGSGSSATFNVAAWYTADSGMISLTSTTGTLTGSLTNVHFIHVAQSSAGKFPGDPPATDSCTSMIASGSFSATLQAGSAAFTGDTYEGTLESGQPIRIHLRNQK